MTTNYQGSYGNMGAAQPPQVAARTTASLSFSYELENGRLVIKTQMRNDGEREIYVLDRLWKLDRASRLTGDPEALYRFQHQDSYRLLLGAAPLPSQGSVLYRNVPHATRLPSRGVLDREYAIARPLNEYSVYFPGPISDDQVLAHVEHIFVLVQFVVATPELSVQPSSAYPDAFQIVKPVAALQHAELAVSHLPASIDVLTRTDDFERVALPGENG